MSYSREDAIELAVELAKAQADDPESAFAEAAAAAAGVPARDLRIVRDAPTYAFLLGETWVIELPGEVIREWDGSADPLYESAEQLDALEDLD